MIAATPAVQSATRRLLAVAHEPHTDWLIVSRRVPRWWLLLKRLTDIALSAALLIVLLPLLACIAIGIRLSSPGPVFFSQQRVGRGGREFRFYKFRTMVDGAHLLHEEVVHLNGRDGPAVKIADDPRVHDFGAILRRTSLDELPQLWNVLRGDMSLVGPRPALPREVNDYRPHYFQRFSVMPGITGLWQVSGRANVPFRRWMAMDVWYARHWTPVLDAWILLRTLPAVIRGEGAW
jgi:lipopolysaccharide/colanic/teichoic acid biosynthesis glycosyltransferase